MELGATNAASCGPTPTLTATGPALRVGGGVTAPRALSAPNPEYDDIARLAQYQGTVSLWVVVDREGNVASIRINGPAGLGLDEKSVEAVNTWKFQPATKDGEPVAVQVNIETNFRLY
jgi:protein TonB